MRKTLMRLQDLLASLRVLTGIYDSFRVVDPQKKKAYSLAEDESLIEEEGRCFDVWGRGAVCTNCISARAALEGESFVKIEGDGKKASTVTAIPMEIHGQTMVLEVIKTMSGGLYIAKGTQGDSVELYGMIESMNLAAVTDPLTGIFNRRYVDERLPAEMVSALVNATPLSVIMADIDYFKAVNDTFGHAAGDAVIRHVAAVCEAFAKNNGGWAARFGGEEFFVCLPHTDLKAAAAAAEGMRRTLEGETVRFETYAISITASFGAAEFDGVVAHGAAPLIGAADRALYAAKKGGRNRVAIEKIDACPAAQD